MLLFRDSLQESLQFCDIRKYIEGTSTSTDTVMTKHQANSLEPPMPAKCSSVFYHGRKSEFFKGNVSYYEP